MLMNVIAGFEAFDSLILLSAERLELNWSC